MFKIVFMNSSFPQNGGFEFFDADGKELVTMKRWKTPMREGNHWRTLEKGGMEEVKRTSVSTRKKCAFFVCFW